MERQRGREPPLDRRRIHPSKGATPALLRAVPFRRRDTCSESWEIPEDVVTLSSRCSDQKLLSGAKNSCILGRYGDSFFLAKTLCILGPRVLCSSWPVCMDRKYCVLTRIFFLIFLSCERGVNKSFSKISVLRSFNLFLYSVRPRCYRRPNILWVSAVSLQPLYLKLCATS